MTNLDVMADDHTVPTSFLWGAVCVKKEGHLNPYFWDIYKYPLIFIYIYIKYIYIYIYIYPTCHHISVDIY